MKQEQTWRQHFNLSSEHAQMRLSDLLSSQIINESEYLDWASASYQKPYLTKQEGEPLSDPASLWLEYKDAYSWSPECMPLATWDGHVIVGCLEPSQSPLPSDLRAIEILCSFTHLNKLWQTYQKANEIKPKIPTFSFESLESVVTPHDQQQNYSEQIKANPKVNQKESQDLAQGASQGHNQVQSQQNQNSEPEAFAPEGLSWKPQENNSKTEDSLLSDASPTEESKQQMNEPDSEGSSAPEAAPEGIQISASLEPVTLTRTDVLSTQQPQQQQAQQIQTQQTQAPELLQPQTMQAELKIEEVTKPNAEIPVPAAEITSEKLEIPVPAAEANRPSLELSAPSAVEIDSDASIRMQNYRIDQTTEKSWLEKAKESNQNLFKLSCDQIFTDLSAYLDQLIILSYNELSLSITPLYWNDHLPSNVSVRSYQITSPNIFRIVSMSEKPFHGAPILNDFNEKFFEDWHGGEIPNHLTIIPLLVSGKVVGMIYGAGPKSSYTGQALKFCETKIQLWFEEWLRQVNLNVA